MTQKVLRLIASIKMALGRWMDEHTCRVLIDGSDNSVSMSKGLTRAAGIFDKDIEGALIVRLVSTDEYAIVFKQQGDVRLADMKMVNSMQYNSKYKTIGFESLTPTVNRILNDYHLPLVSKQKLWVKHKKHNIDYWVICNKK